MLTVFLDIFIPLVTICDSSFVSVRNEPRIFLQKSVNFVCKGRATYSNGFQVVYRPFIWSNLLSSQPMTHRLWVNQMRNHRRQFENLPQNLCFELVLGLEFVSPTFVSPDRWCYQHRKLWKHQLFQAIRIKKDKKYYVVTPKIWYIIYHI